jgi:predicted permease
MDGIGRDVRFAIRVLAREPWFTGGAVVALALGLAVATMAATIINGYHFSGLPTADAAPVFYVGTRDAAGRDRGASYADYENWRRDSRSFAEMGAFAGAAFTIADPGISPDSVGGAYVSASAFRILAVVPALGRAFTAEDDRPGAAAVVVLGHRLWTTRYGADAGALGRTVSIDGAPATVIGVMPEGFEFPFREALWLPLGLMKGIETQSRGDPVLGVFGRLAGGVSRMQARAELEAVAAAVPAAPADQRIEPVVVRFGEQQVGRLGDQQPPLAMIATATFVLLIACANVASLLLARSAGRAREIALRVSVGATRWRIVRQLLVENLIIALAAGALGLWLSRFGVNFIAEGFGRNVPYWMRFGVDGRIVLGLMVLCLLTTVAFGLAPAIIASKSRGLDLVRDGARTPRSRRLTNVLVAAEFALTVTLLACGGLALRSFIALYRADRVIAASRLVTLQMTLDPSRHAPERRAGLLAALDERLSTVPGVQATVASHRPFVGARRQALAFADRPQPRAGQEPQRVPVVAIGVRYFDVLGIRVIHGRGFAALDGAPGHEAAIVNEWFANRYFPEGGALGRRIRLTAVTPDAEPSAWITIVGVAPTVRQAIAAGTGPVVYLPIRTYAGDDAALMAGRADSPVTLVPPLRRAVASFDDRITLHNVTALSELRDNSRLQHRLIGTVLAAFAAVALLLSTVGLYGVTAYSVLQRRHEIGVRVAIGARPAQVVWLFVRRSMLPLAIGGVIGLAGAFAAGRLLQAGLIQTSPTDGVTLAAIVLLLLGAGLTASFVPSRRAARLDPLVVLRTE